MCLLAVARGPRWAASQTWVPRIETEAKNMTYILRRELR